jgi:dTDP-4-amino-4,6-dideoxygalactose transaminase
MISGGYIINPEPQLLPAYRISPFGNQDAHRNRSAGNPMMTDAFISALFNNDPWKYTASGREALGLALKAIGLQSKDVVTILTTTGNFYISGCVTREIEKVCRWSREFLPETKTILVNHEFGFPFEALREVKKYGLPVIEDCAHSFASQNEEQTMGRIGEYVIYSLPKYFPVQVGGILRMRSDAEPIQYEEDNEFAGYLRNALSHYLDSYDDIARLRRANFTYYSELFGRAGLETRFIPGKHTVPGVYMFRLRKGDDADALKQHLWRNGVESSVFYTENTVFIPVHHNLQQEDMEYIYRIITFFLKI